MKQSDIGTYILRSATTADLEAIYELERQLPTAPHWPISTYQACLIPEVIPLPYLLVAEMRGKGLEIDEERRIAGFIVGKYLRLGEDASAEAFAEIESIAVATFARRQGIGTQLCRAMLEWFRGLHVLTVHLEVRSSSDAAIALYQSLGFERHEIRRAYYRSPLEDAVTMCLELPVDEVRGDELADDAFS